jgi:hypothetical protein
MSSDRRLSVTRTPRVIRSTRTERTVACHCYDSCLSLMCGFLPVLFFFFCFFFFLASAFLAADKENAERSKNTCFERCFRQIGRRSGNIEAVT